MLPPVTSPPPPAAPASLDAPPDLTITADGWSLLPDAQHLSGDQIYDYMNGEGEIPVACGYRALHVYQLAHTGGLGAKLELYDQGESSNAFGLYSQWRTADDQIENLTHRARLAAEQIIFWRGKYTARLLAEPPEQGTLDLLRPLAEDLNGQLPGPGNLPDLLRYLPADGRVENSAGFFHGKFALDVWWFQEQDHLRLSPRTNVVHADYAGKELVLIVEYPSAAVAEQVLAAWAESFGAEQAEGGWLAADSLGQMAATAVGARLGLVLYAADEPAAQAMLARLNESLTAPGVAWVEG